MWNSREFCAQYRSSISLTKPIRAGISNILVPILYALCSSDIPHNIVNAALSADDTAISSFHHNYRVTMENLQSAVDNTAVWAKNWKVKNGSNDLTLRNHLYHVKKIIFACFYDLHDQNSLNIF